MTRRTGCFKFILKAGNLSCRAYDFSRPASRVFLSLLPRDAARIDRVFAQRLLLYSFTHCSLDWEEGYQVFQVSMGHPSPLFIKLSFVSISCCCPFFVFLYGMFPSFYVSSIPAHFEFFDGCSQEKSGSPCFRVGSLWSMSTLTPSPGFEFDPLTWVPFFCFWSLRKWVFLPSRKGSHHIITIIHSFKV